MLFNEKEKKEKERQKNEAIQPSLRFKYLL